MRPTSITTTARPRHRHARAALAAAMVVAATAPASAAAAPGASDVSRTGWDRVLPSVPQGRPTTIAAGPGLVVARVEDEVVRSLDAGRTWRPAGEPTAFGVDFRPDVLAVDGATVLRAAPCGVARSVDAGATFGDPVALAGCTDGAVPVLAQSGGVAIAVVGELVLRSDNGGASFAPRGTVTGGLRSPWLVGPQVVLGRGLDNSLRRSADGGATWATVSLPRRRTVTDPGTANPPTVSSLAVSGTTAYVGTSAGVLRSDDLGASWAYVPGAGESAPTPEARSSFARPVEEVACTAPDACLVRYAAFNAEAGVAVAEQTLRLSGGALRDAAPRLPELAAGAPGLIAAAGPQRDGLGPRGLAVSDDGGASYRLAPTPEDRVPRQLVDLTDVWAVLPEGEGLRFSGDTGRTWRAGGPRAVVSRVAGRAAGGLVALDEGGRLHTGSVEGTWTAAQDVSGLRPTGLAAVGRTVYVTGTKGLVRSTDLGRTVNPVDGGSWSGVDARDRTVVVWRDGRVRVSADGGARWRTVATPARRIGAIRVAGRRTLLATTGSGLRRSVDGGRRWRAVPGILRDLRRAPLVARSEREIVLLSGFALLRTTNGGRSWEPAPAPAREVSGLAAGPGGALGVAGQPAGGSGRSVLRSSGAYGRRGRTRLTVAAPRRAVRPRRGARSVAVTITGRLSGARLGDVVQVVSREATTPRVTELDATGRFRARVQLSRGQRAAVLVAFAGDVPGPGARRGTQSASVAVRAARR